MSNWARGYKTYRNGQAVGFVAPPDRLAVREERQIVVEKKDQIKAAIGHSPDFADSLLAAWWCRTYRQQSTFRVRRG